MGDAHSGNVLVDRHPRQNIAARLLYIDYEVTGYHKEVTNQCLENI